MTSDSNKKKSLNVCRLFLFFFFSSYTLRNIFSSVYFKQLGLSSSHVGMLQGASSVAKAFGFFTFGYLADRADLRKPIFLTSLLACAATPLLITLPKPPKGQDCVQPLHRSSQFRVTISEKTTNTSALDVKNRFSKMSGQHYGSVPSQSIEQAKSAERTYGPVHNSTYFVGFHRAPDFIQRKREIEKSLLSLDKRQVKKSKVLPLSNRTKTAHTIAMLPKKVHTRLTYKQTFDEEALDKSDMTNLFAIMLLITIIGDFISGPAVNLTDSAIIHFLEKDTEEYGKIRLWGNVGQMVIIPSVALLVHFQQVVICGLSFDNYIISMYVVSGGMFVAFLVGIKVEMPSSKELRTYNAYEENSESIKEFLRNFLSPLANWTLLVSAFFFGFNIGIFQTFLFWTMIDLDRSQASLCVGVSNFCRNIFSMISFYVSTILLRYFGVETTINISHGLYLVSFIVAAFFRNPWLALIPESLVYTAFALSMAACVMHIGKTAPESWAATAQAILQLLYSGIGSGSGPLVTGIVMDHLGQMYTYLVFAGITLVVLIFSLVVQLILKLKPVTMNDEYQPVPN